MASPECSLHKVYACPECFKPAGIVSLKPAVDVEAVRKVADSMERWWLKDAIKPDEWKMQEWIYQLRKAVGDSTDIKECNRDN